MTKPHPNPMLQHLLDNGTIRIDGHVFVGTAADGVEVTIGETSNPLATERYLRSHPTPDTW